MTGRYDRRTFLARGLISTAGLGALGVPASALLTACGSESSPIQRSTKPPVIASPRVGISSRPPRRGGTLVVGTYSEMSGLAPAGRTTPFDATGLSYAMAVYDPLAILAADGSVKPYLAESFTPNDSYDVWTVKLRPKVVFHDGTPFNADALIANIVALRLSILIGQALKPLSNVAKADDLTVTLTFDQPWVAFPAVMTAQGGFMMTPRYINQDGSLKEEADSKPIGTGPFVLQEWEPNVHFTATANPHYWRAGLPYLDAVKFRPIPDDQSREATLRSGDLNIMHSQDPGNYVDLAGDPHFQVYNDAHSTVGEPSIDCLVLNCQGGPTGQGPTADLRIRQALAYGSDRVAIRRDFFADIPQLAEGLFMPGDPWYDPSTRFPGYDPHRARQLVQAYQAEHPGPVTIGMSGPSVVRYVEIMNAYQSMWSSVGFEVSITTMLQDAYVRTLVSGDFDVGLFQYFQAADPDQNYIFLDSVGVVPPGSIGLNFARFADPRLDAYLDTGRTDPDPQARIRAYQGASRQLVDGLAYLWGWQTLWIQAADARTMNFRGLTCPDGTAAVAFNSGAMNVAATWLDQ